MGCELAVMQAGQRRRQPANAAAGNQNFLYRIKRRFSGHDAKCGRNPQGKKTNKAIDDVSIQL